MTGDCNLYYWRDRNHEVDFVVRWGRKTIAIEVKSGRSATVLRGMEGFASQHKTTRKLLVGGDGIPVEDFLMQPVSHWTK